MRDDAHIRCMRYLHWFMFDYLSPRFVVYQCNTLRLVNFLFVNAFQCRYEQFLSQT